MGSNPTLSAIVAAMTGRHPSIEVGGVFLVETVEEPEAWYMGQRREGGAIECWGRYGPLEVALRAR